MSLVTKIIETELAPLIDIHAPGVADALHKLVESAQNEAINRVITHVTQYVEKAYDMDESGVTPLEPYVLAQRLRNDLPYLCGLMSPTLSQETAGVDLNIDSLDL